MKTDTQDTIVLNPSIVEEGLLFESRWDDLLLPLADADISLRCSTRRNLESTDDEAGRDSMEDIELIHRPGQETAINPPIEPADYSWTLDNLTLKFEFKKASGAMDGRLLAINDALTVDLKTSVFDGPEIIAMLKTTKGKFEARAQLDLFPGHEWHDVTLRYSQTAVGSSFEIFLNGFYIHLHGCPTGAARVAAPFLQFAKLEEMRSDPPGGRHHVRRIELFDRALSNREIGYPRHANESVESNSVSPGYTPDSLASPITAFRDSMERVNARYRERAAGDPLKPRCHFSPSCNWMNDPCGLINWKGNFHVFYQHNPYSPVWGPMHWGHAVSKDLVHWRELPVGAAPDPHNADHLGCFTGCIVDDAATPTMVYTGVFPQVQCLATSDDNLLTWKKSSKNPVIGSPPKEWEVTGFRDPWVWREDGEWRMIVGCGSKEDGGLLPFYSSHDLENWKFLGSFMSKNLPELGDMWECPVFFPLRDKHVVIISAASFFRSFYIVGEYRDGRFHPERYEQLNQGWTFYAPQAQLDAQGRRVIFGWVPERRSEEECRKAGWASALSLPRILDLDERGRLTQTVAPEFAQQTEEALYDGSVESEDNRFALNLDAAEGMCAIFLDLTCEGDGVAVLEFSWSETEKIRLEYRAAEGEIHYTNENLAPDADHPEAREKRFKLDPDQITRPRMELYFDRSILEFFFSRTKSLTDRVYPKNPRALSVSVELSGPEIRIEKMKVQRLRGIL